MKKKTDELKKSFDFQAPAEEKVVEEKKIEPVQRKFTFRLVIRNAFNNYIKGQIVVNEEEIQKIIDGNFLRHCCKSPY